MTNATFIAMSEAFGNAADTLKNTLPHNVLKPLLPSWSKRVTETARNLFAAQQAAWSGHLAALSMVGVSEASREATASDLQAVSEMLKADAENAAQLLKRLHDEVDLKFGTRFTDELLPPLALAIAQLEPLYAEPTA